MGLAIPNAVRADLVALEDFEANLTTNHQITHLVF